jgi:hypothetical protein
LRDFKNLKAENRALTLSRPAINEGAGFRGGHFDDRGLKPVVFSDEVS